MGDNGHFSGMEIILRGEGNEVDLIIGSSLEGGRVAKRPWQSPNW